MRESRGGPLSPEQALASFELEPGYRIDLVASEPLVRDPVATAFDERSRRYVVENRGEALPDGHEGSIFICESAQNLVQQGGAS